MAGKKIGENVLKLLADMGLNTLAPKLEALTRLLGAQEGGRVGAALARPAHVPRAHPAAPPPVVVAILASRSGRGAGAKSALAPALAPCGGARRLFAGPLWPRLGFGAEVHGLDLRREAMTDTARAELARLVQDRGVVVLRGQRGLHLGDQASALAEAIDLPEAPEVDVGFQWHADGVHLVTPPLVMQSTSVYCVAAQRQGATTRFASGRDLYEALSPQRRAEAERVVVRYCRWRTLPGAQLRMRLDGLRLSEDVPPPSSSEPICAERPLVRWVRGGDGERRCVLHVVPAFLHSVRFVGGEELGAQQSRDWIAELLREAGLSQQARGEGCIYEHSWRSGDILLWDNRWVLHRSSPPSNMVGRRMQHNIALGEAAFLGEGPCSAELEAAPRLSTVPNDREPASAAAAPTGARLRRWASRSPEGDQGEQ